MPLLNLNLDAIQNARAELARQRDAQRAAAVALKQAQAELDALGRRTADARELENQQAAVQQLRDAARTALGDTAQQLQALKGLSQRLLGERDPADLIKALGSAQPVMLLPVALQTRYNDDASLLMVRIYPDAIHTFAHEPGLTEAEVGEGKRYWAVRFDSPDDAESPWTQIVRIYAPARSAWIVRSTTPINLDQLGQRLGDGEAPVQRVAPQFNDDAIPLATRDAQTVYATALPDRFVVIGQARGREVFRKWGQAVADLLPMSPAFDPLLVDDPQMHDPFGGDRAWMVDYAAALAAGMAVSITQADLKNGAKMRDRIERLIVLGVDWTQTPDSAADLVGALRRHALVVAEERQPHDLGERRDAGHVDRLERRGHAVGDMGVEKGGVIGGNNEVHFAEEVEGSSARHTVDCGDHRLPEVIGFGADALARVVEVPGRVVAGELSWRQVVHRFDLTTVQAGAECLLTASGEHHAADVVVFPKHRPQFPEFDLHHRVEGVVGLGAIEGDPCHAV